LIKLTNSPEEDNDIQFTYMYHVHTKLGPSHHQFMFINNWAVVASFDISEVQYQYFMKESLSHVMVYNYNNKKHLENPDNVYRL